MGSENLNQRYFQSGDLAVHKNSGQIQLDLKADVNIGSVDCGRPPKSEPSVGNLVQTGPLRMSQLLEFHRLLET